MLHSIDERGLLVAVSDAWLAKMGYARDEVLGRPSADFLTPELREYAIRDVLPRFFRTGRVENVEYQMTCKDGRVLDVLVSAVMVDAPGGSGRASIAVFTDITALKDTKRRLQESEARYRSLVEDQAELVSLAATDGTLLFVNHAYASFYGKQPDEIVGKSLFEFVPEDAHAALTVHLRDVCSADHGIVNENQVLLPSGKRRWIGWTNRALTDADGRVTIHSVGRDIDAQVTAEQKVQESEARYQFLAEHSADLILLTGHDGKRHYASPSCRAMLGYEPEEMLEINARHSIHDEDVGKVLDVLARGDVETPLPFRMKHKDGSYVWVEGVGKAINIDGQPHRNLILIRDITKRVADEQRLVESEARYRLLADSSTDMVFQLDRELVRRYVSPACREVLGYEPEEMCGVRPLSMTHPEDVPRLALVLHSLLAGAVERYSIITRVRHRDDRWIWVEAQLRVVIDPATGERSGIIGTLRDISARKAIEDEAADANRQLRALAREDSLTGLANRRAFDDVLQREHRRARRDKKNLALIMIDVDWFKAFNDRYGHPAGDECLRKIAKTIAGELRRPGDVAARFGGEEFAALLSDTDEEAAKNVADRIRHSVLALAIKHDVSPHDIVTVSAGVAAIGEIRSDDEPDQLLQSADRALYCAKSGGRNTVAVASFAPSSPLRNPSNAA